MGMITVSNLLCLADRYVLEKVCGNADKER